jgi:magnesium transporter
MLDLYLSSVSNRLNEIMKVLTVMSSIFIPLTFLAGVYGMNFNPAAGPWNMPELNWRYGYLTAVSVTVVSTLGTYWYFKKRKWF